MAKSKKKNKNKKSQKPQNIRTKKTEGNKGTSPKANVSKPKSASMNKSPDKDIKIATVKKVGEEPVKNQDVKRKIQVEANILITDGDYTEALVKDEDSAENNEKGIFSKFFKQVR